MSYGGRSQRAKNADQSEQVEDSHNDWVPAL